MYLTLCIAYRGPDGPSKEKEAFKPYYYCHQFKKNNFNSDFSFSCFLSQRILLYSLFCTTLAGAHFSSTEKKIFEVWAGFSFWKDLQRNICSSIFDYLQRSIEAVVR